MPSVRLVRVSYAFAGATPILENLDLDLPLGWTGLVGANGAGKSTLLRLLARELVPTAGHVGIDPAARVRLCHQEVEQDDGIGAFAASSDGADRQLRGRLALDPGDLPRWPTLSPGERKRWQVAAALATAPDVLLLDEPTNHLDAPARALLASALARFRGIGVLVSHDRGLLAALTVRTVRLRKGGLDVYPGPYDEARAAWEASDAHALAQLTLRQEEARRARARLANVRRRRDAVEASRSAGRRMRDRHDSDARSLGADIRAAQAEKRIGREVSAARRAAEQAEAEVSGGFRPAQPGRSVFLGYAAAPRPRLASLLVDALHAGPRVLLRDVNLTLGREDRVRIAGANGAGKSTLLAALLARAGLPPERVVHVPQELAAADRIRLLRELRALPGDERGRVLSLVAALGVDPERLLASERPTPGESRKLQVALGLGRHAWLVALDEPTNHLDLPSIERLESALAAYPGALLLVTHDERLASVLTTRCWHLERGRVVEALPATHRSTGRSR